MKANQDHLTEVVIFNSETGQTMTATKKTFNSIYRDKGFVEVDRDNAEQAAGGAKSNKPTLARPSRGGGSGSSAKDVAKEIGLEKDSDQPADDTGGAMTFGEAAKDSAERNKDRQG